MSGANIFDVKVPFMCFVASVVMVAGEADCLGMICDDPFRAGEVPFWLLLEG